MKQSGKEWEDFRRKHLTSTDSYKIWEGKDADLMSVWEHKQGLSEPVQVNEAMMHGKRMEPIARDFFNKHMKDVFWPDVRENRTSNWMGASLDGVNFGDQALLEIKCPYSSNLLAEAKKGLIPESHLFQMYHQMLTTDIFFCFYLVFVDEDNYHIEEVSIDDKTATELFHKERDFWKFVIDNKPPIAQRQDQRWIDLEKAYIELAEKKKQISDEIDVVLDELKNLSGGASAYGPSLMLTKYLRKGNVDYGKISELKNVDLEEYRKEASVCWRAKTR